MSTDAATTPASPPPPADSALPPAAAAAAHAAVKDAPQPTSSSEGDASSENENKTVFHSATDFTVKHPLYAPWTLWFDSASKQDKAKSWDDALSEVVSFQSVEDFWGLYNNIIPPSLLSANSNYYLFKEGIKPAWEDAANQTGGKWSVQLPRGKYTEQIDAFWLYTMLAAIGETFETPYTSPSSAPSSSDPPTDAAAAPTPLPATFTNEICGVIVSARKAFFRINIWTRSSSSSPSGEGNASVEHVKEKVENIGRHFKYGVLGFEEGKPAFSEKDKVSSDVEFVSHKDSQAKYGTKVQKWTV
ncbi:hypothetical protein JCM6882_008167 [Rhodosporidiobolus microsporus]